MFIDSQDLKEYALSYYETFPNNADDSIYFFDFDSLFTQILKDKSLSTIENFPELMDTVFKKYFE